MRSQRSAEQRGDGTVKIQVTKANASVCTAAALAALACTFALAMAMLAPAPAQAAEEHLFDPVLSLEGDCKGEDGARDPGCIGEPPEYPAGSAPKAFSQPCGLATDPHGDAYLSTPSEANVAEGRIDVFGPQGGFVTEIPNTLEPCNLAVDSAGNLYVVENTIETAEGFQRQYIVRYEPSEYPPQPGVEYTQAARLPFLLREPGEPAKVCASPESIAVDPSNDHLYVYKSPCHVEEYGSAAEGTPVNPLIESGVGEAALKGRFNFGMYNMDVYGANHDLYLSGTHEVETTRTNYVLVLDAGGEVKCELEGSGVGPHPSFDFGARGGPLAIDQSNGDLYVYDAGNGAVEQFGGGGEGCPDFIGELPATPKPLVLGLWYDLAVDAPLVEGDPGYDSPNEGYVYFTSGVTTNNSHLWAFRPKLFGPPEVRAQSIEAVTEDEAVLKAELNPDALVTEYHFEYTTQAAYDEHGYEDATSVPLFDKSLGAGGAFVSVSAPATGLAPGTRYHFRLVASNCADPEAIDGDCLTAGEGKPGKEGEDASFATYPEGAGPPDGRAYELVTPPDTHGHVPTMKMLGYGNGSIGFATTMVSPDGESLVFGTLTGSLPGIGGGGAQDTFEAVRGEGGWLSHFTGLSGAQAQKPNVGGISPGHAYAFWNAVGDKGSFALGSNTTYLRVPVGVEPSPNCAPAAESEGRFELIGCGSLGAEPEAEGGWISSGGGHVIFVVSPQNLRPAHQLERCASRTGKASIYDRTPGGPTRCISLLPNGEAPEANADYKGASADGTAVAFRIESTLYVRRHDAETLTVATGSPTFAGLSADDSRVFYLSGGNIFYCDLDEGSCAGEGAHAPVPIGSGGQSIVVNVSPDGSHVYFISKARLTGAEENGHGAKAKAGEENLYVWDGEAVRFIAIVSALDVEGEFFQGGLGRWVSEAINPGNPQPAHDTSRSTPGGSTLVFESRQNLTGYDSTGHIEIYRFDAEAEGAGRLLCLSCNPTGSAAVADARLQSQVPANEVDVLPPVNPQALIYNVTVDGRKVFFESSERLVSADTDGLPDVYEWEADGEGACKRAAGCLSLISGGNSAEPDYLYAMTPDGHDVFFLSGDTLVPQDPDTTYSIYDARVGGGFPASPPSPGDCLGEACQPSAAPPGEFNSTLEEEAAPRPCPKGRRKVRQNGKTRCVKVKTKKHHRRHRRAHTKRGAVR
jgi:hypothetical protein